MIKRTTALLALMLTVACWVTPAQAQVQEQRAAQQPDSRTEPVVAAPADAAVDSAGVAPPGGAPVDATAASESSTAAPVDTRGLDEQIQSLKKDVVDLNKDLFVLEEELLFPANTQVAVFVSMDVGEFFALDSVQLKIDNREVSNYLYTPREAEALLKGGVQRIYVGNLKVGKHELVALFAGKGPNQRDYRRGANLRFEKSVGAKYLELKITDRQRRAQPEFAIRDWE
ncbi:MAG: AraC family transcriptional regulator [Pseudomonadales bacterium]|nr:AraC family transcriptional regulator [Pseudomonadales bacterium]